MAATVASSGAWPVRSGSQPASMRSTSTWSIDDVVVGASQLSRAAVSAAGAVPASAAARRVVALFASRVPPDRRGGFDVVAWSSGLCPVERLDDGIRLGVLRGRGHHRAEATDHLG